MTKTQQILEQMLTQNIDLFEQFKKVHDSYIKNPNQYKNEFDQLGFEIQDVIRRYENILCGKSENGGYGRFTSNLSEKFHQEVKKIFPKIDSIGLEIS